MRCFALQYSHFFTTYHILEKEKLAKNPSITEEETIVKTYSLCVVQYW